MTFWKLFEDATLEVETWERDNPRRTIQTFGSSMTINIGSREMWNRLWFARDWAHLEETGQIAALRKNSA